MARYSDCYRGCGGEDCACCEVHVEHTHESYEPASYDDYDPYMREFEPDEYDDEDW